MLTDTGSIRARLAAAQSRERAARAESARLRRDLAASDRRREAARLCVLGRAWETWGERDPRFKDAALRFLAAYVARDTDRAALAGTPWSVPDAPVPAAAASGE